MSKKKLGSKDCQPVEEEFEEGLTIDNSCPLYTPFFRPETKGEEFDFNYKWYWFDEDTGELKSDTVDQAAQVQSHPPISAQGLVEEFEETGNVFGFNKDDVFYGDTTGLVDGDLPTVMRYLSDLERSIAIAKEEAAKLAEKAGKDDGQGQKDSPTDTGTGGSGTDSSEGVKL